MIEGKILVYLRAPVLSLTGYGQSARQIFDYLSNDNRFLVCLDNINWGSCPYIHNHPKQMKYYEAMKRFEQAKGAKLQYDMSVHVTIPNEFFRNAKLNILCTAGIETDRISKVWVDKCNEADAIVVPSQFSKKIMAGTVYEWEDQRTKETGEFRINKPIFVIPHWFEHPENVEKYELNLTTKKNFLCVGLWGNKGGFGEDRKNIADTVKLFLETFKDDPDVGLVLKTSIINNSKEDKLHTEKRLKEIKDNFKNVKCKLYLLHDTLTDAQMYSIYTNDKILAMLSFTHGEGFGLPMLEAHSVGLPVIATNWSGHLDFLREKHGFIPVPAMLKDIPKCQVWQDVLEDGSRWAVIDSEEAKKIMRKFANSSSVIKKAAQSNRKWLDENFSKDYVITKWREFLDNYISEKSEEELSRTEVSGIENEANSVKQQKIKELKQLIKESDKEKVLFILPRSFGDTVIATSIVRSLLTFRHTDCDFYYAIAPEYREILNKIKDVFNITVLDFKEEMMFSELTSEVWDVVYNPGVNIQYNFSNWLLGNGKYAVRLLEEFAKQCNLNPRELCEYMVPTGELSESEYPEGPYITLTPVTSKQSKNYKHWQDVVDNIKQMGNLQVVQLGQKDEKLLNGTIDRRGVSYTATADLIDRAVLNVSPDTGTAHLAAALNTPHVVLYASTDAGTCCPVVFDRNVTQVCVEANDEDCCGPKCYKDKCAKTKDGKNCLSTIPAEDVCNVIYNTLYSVIEFEREKSNNVDTNPEQVLEV